MNIYKIELQSGEVTKQIGYASGLNEYDAVKAIGFTNVHTTSYLGSNPDAWMYSAKNAIGCKIIVTKL